MPNNLSDLEIVRLNIQLTKKEACTLYSIKNIAFTGGEPTLHKDILELADYARKYSPKVSVTTNGYYCSTKERTNALVDAGVNRFSFSYHGVGKQDEFCGVQGS